MAEQNKKQDVKKKILEATLDIISKETISGTRMRAIAEEAGVVQSNLHYYFNSKNELLLSNLDYILDLFQKQRVESVKDYADNPLKKFYDQKKELLLKEKKLDFVQFDFWIQAFVNPEIMPKMKNFFKVWRDEIIMASGDQNESSSSEMNIKSSIIISMLTGASMQYLIDEDSFDIDGYFTTVEKVGQMLFKNSIH